MTTDTESEGDEEAPTVTLQIGNGEKERPVRLVREMLTLKRLELLQAVAEEEPENITAVKNLLHRGVLSGQPGPPSLLVGRRS